MLVKDVILGTVIGDVVGSRFEINNNKYGKEFEMFHKNCRFTDDTVMTLAICEAFCNSKSDLSDIKNQALNSMVELGKKYSTCGFGPQGNATTGVGVDKRKMGVSIYEVLTMKNTIEESIVKTKSNNLSIVPAYLNLAGAEMELLELERKYKDTDQKFNRVKRLKEELDKIKDNYDYIIIDCPPSLGILTTNALAAANSVLIPVQCEYYALEGIMQLINTIMLAQRKVNPSLDIEGVLLTMLSVNTNLGLEVIGSIKEFFKERVYDTIIPRLIKLAEAPSHGKTILDYDPRGKGTRAYLNLAKEVIDRNGRKQEESIG